MQPPRRPEVRSPNTPPGLVCRAVVPTRRQDDGTHRAITASATGLPRYSEVDLEAVAPVMALDASVLDVLVKGGDRRFVLEGAHRSWSAIQGRYGERAWPLALELARAGAIVIRCRITRDMALGRPLRWYRTPAAAHAAEGETTARSARRTQLRTQLHQALEALPTHAGPSGPAESDSVRGLTDHDVESVLLALRHELDRPTPAPKRTRILIALAQDLCDGTVHANARAFSQVHTGHTKTWDDARSVLEAVGVTRAVAIAVGLHRDSRIGAGGAITCRVAHALLSLDVLRGPLLFRAEQSDLSFSLTGTRLVIVENLQAAETLCDTFVSSTATKDIGIVYCAGMPSTSVTERISALADQATKIIIAPDADLGGVRIATAIHQSLTPRAQARSVLCDAAATHHVRQRPWAPDSPVWEGLSAALSGPAAALAQGCLDRGYPVEQEAPIVESVLCHL